MRLCEIISVPETVMLVGLVKIKGHLRLHLRDDFNNYFMVFLYMF